MGSPAWRLLLLPEHWNVLENLEWMLWHRDLPLTACEPEAHTELIPEPEPTTIKAPESTSLLSPSQSQERTSA